MVDHYRANAYNRVMVGAVKLFYKMDIMGAGHHVPLPYRNTFLSNNGKAIRGRNLARLRSKQVTVALDKPLGVCFNMVKE